MKLSAVVITRNEAQNIQACLKDLRFCDEIVLVDSGSADETVSIARGMGARVFTRAFTDYASQKNFGIDQARGDWVFSVDADERVSPELAAEIRSALESPSASGYRILRRNRIFGRWMCHGAHADDWQLRLVRRSQARFSGIVHEKIFLRENPSRLKNPLLHHSTTCVSDYLRKLNAYTDLEARTLEVRGAKPSKRSMQARPLLSFGYWVFVRRGFLDGLEGMLFCVLSAYYEFVRRAKHWERG